MIIKITEGKRGTMKEIMLENKTEQFSFFVSKDLMPTPHLHKEIEMIYVINGCYRVFADRKSELVSTGDLFISFPNQIHYYEGEQQGDYLVVIFSPDVLFELKGLLYDHIPECNVLRGVAESEAVAHLLRAWKMEGIYRRTAVAGCLNLTMASLLPMLQLKGRMKTDHSTLQSVLNYCAQNYASELTLDGVAQALHISKYHISHLFGSKLGVSFNAYLNTIRINEACDLLETTNQKIADISNEVGFGSISTFNRAFLQAMKRSPQQYRKELQRTEPEKGEDTQQEALRETPLGAFLCTEDR